MNNSVFSRFNFVDAIIILTSAKLILHPIYSKISMKQYGFNHLLKLKRGIHEPEPKPEPIRVDLPDDVIVSILSKVDIDTLRRCTLVLSLDSILPQIVSFSTPLDASLFNPDKSGSWYGKLFNQVILNCIPLIEFIMERQSVIYSTVIDLTVYVFWWVNMRKLKPEVINFLQRLSGLELLEIELPAIPCYECRVRPHLWYRWDAKIKVNESVSNYCLYVFGDKVNNSDSDYCDMDDEGEEEEEANRRRELRQIVSEITSDENCRVIFDSH